jgi:hypothetical protein
MSSERLDISDSFTWEEGLPRPQWEILDAWAKSRDDQEGFSDGWTDSCRQWLEKLGETLGKQYRSTESENFLLLAPHPEPPGEVLAAFGEQCRDKLLTSLQGVTAFRAPGKQVALVLRNSDTYYKYLSVYYPEGHHGGSSGVHIREGYPHIALWGPQLAQLENTLAHEMTHASLVHLSLPQWVEEGLAHMFEHNMTGRSLLLVDGEMARRHKRYWGRNGLEAFWRGEGFSRPGKVQELCYQLAEILIRLLIEDYRPRWFGLDKGPQRRFFAFLREADMLDCGESAAREHLGIGLGELAGRFLGPGEWSVQL